MSKIHCSKAHFEVYNRPTSFSRVTILISGIYGCVVWLERYPVVWLWG